MINLIAWRNVWRNKMRSAILVGAIAFGIWAGVLTTGLMVGMAEQMVHNAIKTQLSHIQIHVPTFRLHKEISKVIPNGKQVVEILKGDENITNVSGRIVVAGMASSSTAGNGVTITGINPVDEGKVSDIHNSIVDGTYFNSNKRNPIVIGIKLAKKLDVRLNQKIVLTVQGMDGTIASGAFRIVGLFKTVSSEIDKQMILAQDSDVERVFGVTGQIHEIAIITDNVDGISDIEKRLQNNYPDLDVESWEQLSPDLAMMAGMTETQMGYFMAIIMIALIFGITNTMLMGVFERMRELGIVMALGMKHGKIFLMIMLETIYLAIIGGLVGVIISALTIQIIGQTGLDMTIFSDALAVYGISEKLYPIVYLKHYISILSMVAVTAFLAAIYPGIKAIRLKPVEAIRTY